MARKQRLIDIQKKAIDEARARTLKQKLARRGITQVPEVKEEPVIEVEVKTEPEPEVPILPSGGSFKAEETAPVTTKPKKTSKKKTSKKK